MLKPTFAAVRYTALDRQQHHPAGGGLLQRQCRCGKHTIGGGVCELCQQHGATISPRTLNEPGPATPPHLQTFGNPSSSFDFSSIPARTIPAAAKHIIQPDLAEVRPWLQPVPGRTIQREHSSAREAYLDDFNASLIEAFYSGDQQNSNMSLILAYAANLRRSFVTHRTNQDRLHTTQTAASRLMATYRELVRRASLPEFRRTSDNVLIYQDYWRSVDQTIFPWTPNNPTRVQEVQVGGEFIFSDANVAEYSAFNLAYIQQQQRLGATRRQPGWQTSNADQMSAAGAMPTFAVSDFAVNRTDGVTLETRGTEAFVESPGINIQANVTMAPTTARSDDWQVGFLQTVTAYSNQARYHNGVVQWPMSPPKRDALTADVVAPWYNGFHPITAAQSTVSPRMDDRPFQGVPFNIAATGSRLRSFRRTESFVTWLVARHQHSGALIFLRHVRWDVVLAFQAQPSGGASALADQGTQLNITSQGEGHTNVIPIESGPIANSFTNAQFRR